MDGNKSLPVSRMVEYRRRLNKLTAAGCVVERRGEMYEPRQYTTVSAFQSIARPAQ